MTSEAGKGSMQATVRITNALFAGSAFACSMGVADILANHMPRMAAWLVAGVAVHLFLDLVVSAMFENTAVLVGDTPTGNDPEDDAEEHDGP